MKKNNIIKIYLKNYVKVRKQIDIKIALKKDLKKVPTKKMLRHLNLLLDGNSSDIIFGRYEDILEILQESEQDMNNYLKYLKKEDLEFENKVIRIIDSIKPYKVIDILPYISGISKKTDEYINGFYEKNKEIIAKQLIENYTTVNEESITPKNKKLLKYNNITKGESKYPKNYEMVIYMIIDELLESEKCEFKNIRKVGQGSYSTVFEIGSNVFKIGKEKGTYFMPNHRRILQPIIRKNIFKNLYDEKGELYYLTIGHIEVMQKVKTNLSKEELTEADMYEIYTELRKEGIYCPDLRRDNIGKLLKPNYTYIDNKIIKPDDISRGFTRNLEKNEILQAGEFVIPDIDLFYTDFYEIPKNLAASDIFQTIYDKQTVAEIAEINNKIDRKYNQKNNNNGNNINKFKENIVFKPVNTNSELQQDIYENDICLNKEIEAR